MEYNISMDQEQVKQFINSVKWTRAKTYEKTSPHEYTVIKVEHPLREQAVAFMNFIFDHGVEELYFGHPFIVCYINDRKYWCMAKTKDEISDDNYIINRTTPETTHIIYG